MSKAQRWVLIVVAVLIVFALWWVFTCDLHDAADGNDLLAVKIALWRGQPINGRDYHERTALYLAMARDPYEGVVARYLLQRGADPNLHAVFAFTALHQAANSGNAEMVELLLRKGADPNAKGYDDNRPLNLLSRGETARITRLLIDAGADVNASNTEGRVPLMAAQNTASGEMLLEVGANHKAVDKEGNTVLHWVCSNGGMDAAFVEKLIKKGSDINAVNKEGATPLNFSAAAGNKAVIAILKKHGAVHGKIKR